MTLAQRIRLGLLCAKLKLENVLTTDASYPKDPDPKNWRTIKGSHVHLTNGKIDGGAGGKFKGNPWTGKQSHGHNSFFPPPGWTKPAPAPTPPPQPATPPPQPAAPAPTPTPATPPSAAPGAPPDIVKQYISSIMKGSYKNTSSSTKAQVDAFLKSGNTDELPVFPTGTYEQNDELCEKAFQAWKDKHITKTAAQNLVAYAIDTPKSVVLKSLANKWQTAAKTAKAPAAKIDYKAEAEKIVEKMDNATSMQEKKDILLQAGLTDSQAVVVMYNYDMDELNGSNEAVKMVTTYLDKNDGAKMTKPSTPAVTYNDLTASEKDVINYVKVAVATGSKPEQIQNWYLPDAKKEFAEMAVALTMEYAKNPTATAQKELHDKLAQIYKGKYKASKEDLAVWKAWKNGGTTAGGASTPSANFNPYDFSDAAVGWKLPKGTQMSFKDSNGADFKAYKATNAAACKKMTKKQLAAVWRYTAGSTHLRDWLVYGKTDSWYKDSGNDSYKYGPMGWTNPYKNGMTGDALQKAADAISAGLKKVKHPDIIVNRNCSLMDWATADNPGGLTFKDLQDMAASGKVFENKAFISATPLEKSVYGSSEARRHIFVPKKANGAFINSVSEYDHENEFLLDKNTKTRIIKVEKDKSGTIHVYEEVVLDD